MLDNKLFLFSILCTSSMRTVLFHYLNHSAFVFFSKLDIKPLSPVKRFIDIYNRKKIFKKSSFFLFKTFKKIHYYILAIFEEFPSSSSILIRRLYLDTLSDLDNEPVLICDDFVATAKSAINVSSESPDLCEITV